MINKNVFLCIVIGLSHANVAFRGCGGLYADEDARCRPQACQTPVNFTPPGRCLESSLRGWSACEETYIGSHTNNKEAIPTHVEPVLISRISTRMAKTENGEQPAMDIALARNAIHNTDIDVVLMNMTSIYDIYYGDPYFYWYPDRRMVTIPAIVSRWTRKEDIIQTYRGFSSCNESCDHFGCYVYVLQLIHLSRQTTPPWSVVTYHITLYNITGNMKLSTQSLAWKSAIAVAILYDNVHVVFERLPPRLAVVQKYDIEIYSSTNDSIPVRTHTLSTEATEYTYTFVNMEGGRYYVEVHSVLLKSDVVPWSRSKIFSIPQTSVTATTRTQAGDTIDNIRMNKGKRSESHSVATIAILAVTFALIVLTVIIFVIRRYATAAEHILTDDDETWALQRSTTANEFIDRSYDYLATKLFKFNEELPW